MSINIAVLGCGRIGVIHAASVAASSRAKLAAVSDPISASAERLAAKYGCKTSSIEAILNDPGIDAVVIGTPTDTHADLIEAAAARQKAVMCEKPVDMNADRIRKCIEVTRGAVRPIMVGFNRRFDPHFGELQRQLVSGLIGDLEILTFLSRDPSPPPISYIERSGGLYRDMMIHDLDLARFFLSEEPIEIFAVGSALVDEAIGHAGDVDTAAVVMTTASGRIVQISCSRRATYGFDNRIEAHGSLGLLTVGNATVSNVVAATKAGFLHPRTVDFFPERYEASYRAEFEAFMDAIEGREVTLPTLRDGLAAQLLADAATISQKEARPVKLQLQ